MYNKIKNPPTKSISTNWFQYVENQLNKKFKDHGTITLENLVQIDDSDKPGLIESGVVRVSGTTVNDQYVESQRYQACFWHNSSYSKFEPYHEVVS